VHIAAQEDQNMPQIKMTRRIAAPIDTVYSLFTDVKNVWEHIDGIEKIEMLTDGPVREGTRFRETRIMFKKPTTEEFEVTAIEPNKRFAMTSESTGCRFEAEHRFTPDGNGTRVDFEINAKALTFGAKLMTPLMYLMQGTMKKCMNRDFDQLQARAEGSVQG
jgi:carbon monoxide dehydrogenase subunit G